MMLAFDLFHFDVVQPAVLLSHVKLAPATCQSAVFFSHNKSAPATNQPNNKSVPTVLFVTIIALIIKFFFTLHNLTSTF
jgi:uncharacterized integral membrane protein